MADTEKLATKNLEYRALALYFFSIILIYNYINLNFSGPVYSTDEVGYLTNAAALLGYIGDNASSYHYGYAVLIAPAFLLMPDFDAIWRAVVFINSILFILSFVMLYAASTIVVPGLRKRHRIAAIMLCALYPAWPTISGYAFSQPGFVFAFVASFYTLILGMTRDRRLLLAHGLCVGYLGTIHETGLVVLVASALALVFAGLRLKDWKAPLASLALAVAILFLYRTFFFPMMVEAMTPAGQQPRLHYPELGKVLGTLVHGSQLAEMLTRALGALTYLTISTLGFAAVGLGYAATRSCGLLRKSYEPERIAALFCFLSLAGIVAIGAMMFTAEGAGRSDHWMYGRYAEGALLPILFLGLSQRRARYWSIAGGVVAALFIYRFALVYEHVDALQARGNSGFNLINVSGYWPNAFFDAWPIWKSAGAGAAASVLVPLFPRSLGFLLLAVAFLVAWPQQIRWHSGQTSALTPPASFMEFIRDEWPTGSCVAIDFPQGPESPSHWRMQINHYYLLDYHVQRMSIAAWQAHCDGPMLTYRSSDALPASVEVLAKEKEAGLSIVARSGTRTDRYPDLYVTPHICTGTFCMGRNAESISRFSQVGHMVDGRWSTDGRPGYLMYGPYLPIPRGAYRVEIRGVFNDTTDLYVDAVAGRGASQLFARTYTGVPIADSLVFEFEADEDYPDIEIRMRVGAATDVSLSGYSIEKVE